MMKLRPLCYAVARAGSRASTRSRTHLAATWLSSSSSSLSFAALFFSTKAADTSSSEVNLQQKLLQRLCWEAYLASGRGSDTLFQSIDYGSTGFISRKELVVFLNSVDGKGVNPKAFKILDVLADDHQIDLKEFKSWLIIATKFTTVKNSAYKTTFESHPDLGERKPQEESEYGNYSWNEVTMSQSLRRMQYAVRGEVVMKADKLKAAGREILYTNIGNPHSVEQKPITFFRQVLALCDLPASEGVDHPNADKMFPRDVIERARTLREAIGPSGTGAYTNSQGVLGFRENIAKFIAKRDGHPAYSGNIFLTNGAVSFSPLP